MIKKQAKKRCKHIWVTPSKKNFQPDPVTTCNKCGKVKGK